MDIVQLTSLGGALFGVVVGFIRYIRTYYLIFKHISVDEFYAEPRYIILYGITGLFTIPFTVITLLSMVFIPNLYWKYFVKYYLRGIW